MTIVRDLLERKGTTVTAVDLNTSVLDAARRMNDRRIGAVVVMENDHLLGIFTERDILTRVVGRELEPSTTLIRDVMTSPVLTVDPDMPIQACGELVTDRRIRHLPVVEEGRLIGMISAGDLLKGELDESRGTLQEMKEYLIKS